MLVFYKFPLKCTPKTQNYLNYFDSIDVVLRHVAFN